MDPTSKESKGSRTLVETLDAYARKQPDKIFSYAPVSSDLDDGFREVTFQDISQAVDAFAWWLASTYGRSTSFETITYLGVNDLRYAIVFFASIKVGYKAFLLSPSNPPSQIHQLLQQTSCTKLFFSQEYQDTIEQILGVSPDLSIELVEPLLYWVASYHKKFPYKKSYESVKNDPILVLQSVDETNNAKPIILNNGYFGAADAQYPEIQGRRIGPSTLFDFPDGGNFFCPDPLFQLSGFFCACVYPLFSFSGSNILAPHDPETDSTPEMLQHILDWKDVKLLVANSALIDKIAEVPGGTRTLSKLESLAYVGSPLSRTCGDALAKHGIQVCQFYGSIETGWIPFLVPKSEDWEYTEFHPDLNIDMEPVLNGDICELVYPSLSKSNEIRSNEHEARRGIDWTFPKLQEYRTQDLFAPHPSKSGLWRYHGRVDDHVCLKTAVNALDFERLLLSSAKIDGVSGALLVGNNRGKLGLLLERKEGVSMDNSALVDVIWPIVAQVNVTVPDGAHVRRNMIRVVDAGGLLRTYKGTILRKASEQKYAALIASMYERHLVNGTA